MMYQPDCDLRPEITVASALFTFIFLSIVPRGTIQGFHGALVAPGIRSVCSFPLCHPRAQPQPAGIRWSSCPQNHVPGRAWRGHLPCASQGKFPPAATWPRAAQGSLRLPCAQLNLQDSGRSGYYWDRQPPVSVSAVMTSHIFLFLTSTRAHVSLLYLPAEMTCLVWHVG